MRGLSTAAAVLAYGPAVATLPPRRGHRETSWADGIRFACCWCPNDDCRVIAEDPMRPGQSVTATCDRCGGLTQITRRTAMFA